MSLALALTACVLNGVASVLLVATLNRALSQPGAADASLAWRFALCAVIALVTRIVSGTLFARLSQDTMARLRVHLARRVGAAELRDIERIGAAPVQSVLTDDATNVSMLFFALPKPGHARLDRVRLPRLSRVAVVAGMPARAGRDHRRLARLSHRRPPRDRIARSGRLGWDRLFGYLGSLFSGAKELKLHDERARQFVDGQLGAAIGEVRDHRRRAFSAYAVGVGWIIFLFYVFLGIASFWPQLGVHADPAAAAGYVVVFLFMLVPLDGLLNNLPTVNAARVSLTRIEGVMAEFGALRTVPPASDAPDVPPAGAVTLRGVTHAYFHERDERMFSIGPINLTIQPGGSCSSSAATAAARRRSRRC